MAAGVTDRLWDIEDIVRLVDDAALKPKTPGHLSQAGDFKVTHYRSMIWL